MLAPALAWLRWAPSLASILRIAALGIAMLATPTSAPAQEIRRPADEGPETPVPGPTRPPTLETPRRAAPDGLPPLPDALAPYAALIRSIEVRGASALDPDEIRAITEPYVDRRLTTAELAALADALTRAYHERGYVTSGALLPDQDLEGGRLVVQIVEGSVGEIRIEGNRFFSTRYLRARLRAATASPLRVDDVTNRLAILQRNPRIERVDAVLEPTARLGVSDLRVVVRETNPWDVTLFAANDLASSVGSENGGFRFARGNLFGMDDELAVSARFSEGVREVQVSARAPINAADTELRARYQYVESRIVTPSLSDLEIESTGHYADLELAHPLFRDRTQSLWAGVVASWSRSASGLLGRGFCFQATIVDCTPVVSAIRLRQEYALRTRRTALSIRSTVSFGLDLLWATSDLDDDLPDGEFVSWLAQLRLVRRLPMEAIGLEGLAGSVLVLRGDVQLADEPLLPSEQISLGGPSSVRGYRRNALVRDTALIGSVELRLPVWKRAFAQPVVELAPFFDVGRATDVNVVAAGPGSDRSRELSSLGLALRVSLPSGLYVEGSWAHGFSDHAEGGDGFQREGVYFRVSWDVF